MSGMYRILVDRHPVYPAHPVHPGYPVPRWANIGYNRAASATATVCAGREEPQQDGQDARDAQDMILEILSIPDILSIL